MTHPRPTPPNPPFASVMQSPAPAGRTVSAACLGRLAYMLAMTAVPVVAICGIEAASAPGSAIGRHASSMFAFADLWNAQSEGRDMTHAMQAVRMADLRVGGR